MAPVRRYRASIAVIALFAATGAATAQPACSVDALTALHVPGLTVTTAAPVPAADQTPAHCDVKGTVATSGAGAPPGSAGFEIQLPATWQRRFIFSGVGGNGGSFTPSANPVDRAGSLAKGYATAITDMGHQGLNTDASWVIEQSGKRDEAKVVDFFHRAAHDVTVSGKAFVQAFYGAPIEHAYFDGCSTGGRMALMEAEKYPQDYDGVIAGDPAMDYHAQLGRIAIQKAQLSSVGAYIPASLLPAIDRAVMASCDAVDGVTDGLVQNPARCQFKPEAMLCHEAGGTDCLSAAQVTTLRTYLSPVRDAHGKILFPGMSPTDLAGRSGMTQWTIGTATPDPSAAPTPWGDDFAAAPQGWKYMRQVLSFWLGLGPNYRMADFALDPRTGVVGDATLKLFDAHFAGGNTYDPAALQPFIRNGGKLILYHGFSDPAISPYRSVMFYQQLLQADAKARDSVRLFMVPGMHHCRGGPGPDSFDTLTALENWVEHGSAPAAILATASGGRRTMPLCPFPEQAEFRGNGNVNDAANWRCAAAARQAVHSGHANGPS